MGLVFICSQWQKVQRLFQCCFACNGFSILPHQKAEVFTVVSMLLRLQWVQYKWANYARILTESFQCCFADNGFRILSKHLVIESNVVSMLLRLQWVQYLFEAVNKSQNVIVSMLLRLQWVQYAWEYLSDKKDKSFNAASPAMGLVLSISQFLGNFFNCFNAASPAMGLVYEFSHSQPRNWPFQCCFACNEFSIFILQIAFSHL